MQVLVCSDSNEVLERARGFFPRDQVVTFEDHPVFPGQPLHLNNVTRTPAELQVAALRLIAEMRAMALSERFFFGSIRRRKGSKGSPLASGFSLLVSYLHENRSSVAFFSDDKDFQDRNNPRYPGAMLASNSVSLRRYTIKVRRFIKLLLVKRKKLDF